MYYDLNVNDAWTTLFGGVFLIVILFGALLMIPFIIASWKLFKKAGKKGWEAIVPFYNSWIIVEISGLEWWWFLLTLAPTILGVISDDLAGLASLISFFASFNCWYNIAKKFKKDTTTSVLAGIFSFVFVFIFAFSSKNKYYAEEKVSKYGVLGKFFDKEETTTNTTDNTTTNNNNSNASESNQFCSSCGAKLDGNYKFCPKCGKEL